MNYSFVAGQFRLVAVGLIAFATGRHWITADDASAVVAIAGPAALLVGPVLWSWSANWRKKLVPSDSVAIGADQAQVTPNGVHAVITGAQTPNGATIARVVG